jgi:hypothetical protein
MAEDVDDQWDPLEASGTSASNPTIFSRRLSKKGSP